MIVASAALPLSPGALVRANCKTKGMGTSVNEIASTNDAVRQGRRAKWMNQRATARLQSKAVSQTALRTVSPLK